MHAAAWFDHIEPLAVCSTFITTTMLPGLCQQVHKLPVSSIPTAPVAHFPLHKTSSGTLPPQPGESVSLAGRGATFRSQAGALYRKNAVYQRRNWCSNCCLLSAPIFFCLLLFGIQIAINKLLLTGDDYAVRAQQY